ncbi:putative two-component system response regulator [Desulfacinum infernum DSM 9756]|uniref:Putative two-component system response regulator n=1 Tax=Desulfacinum infernum DSM 9756 TaxID=1121391 RepID=A0A1M5CAI8_9BACT|nr:two-component system response regulator [Desulfacinum infernum]SHF51452.1 putative two-component system response regulator [Desulfacinum infernum DSM 9756]
MPVILVADDEKRYLDLLRKLLEPLGYEVVTAEDGLDAWRRVRENPPDLILLDLAMPGLDGLEVLRRVKADAVVKHIPVVMVTGMDDSRTRVEALEEGADDFLSKPFDYAELRARVRSLLKVKAYHDHLRRYNLRLEKTVEERTRELREALEHLKAVSEETILRLCRAAEYRDEETGMHIWRMSRYSAAVAEAMGLGSDFVESMLHAAPMHDIGKIGIPDHILLKPGRLTDHEREIMKKHTLIGARILEGGRTAYVRMGEVIALTHHEKWNGTGYPRGLKGNEIPLEGRIVAVADVFDALTSRRPYKEPYSLEKSLEVIGRERGGHFDPEVVDAFFRALDRIRSIREEFDDRRAQLMPSQVSAGFQWGDAFIPYWEDAAAGLQPGGKGPTQPLEMAGGTQWPNPSLSLLCVSY